VVGMSRSRRAAKSHRSGPSDRWRVRFGSPGRVGAAVDAAVLRCGLSTDEGRSSGAEPQAVEFLSPSALVFETDGGQPPFRGGDLDAVGLEVEEFRGGRR